MEKLDQWNDDDVFGKNSSTMKNPEIPTCSQLTKNHILSVKHSIKVELCEAEKFIDIDAEFLTTQICGMLNTEKGGAIYLGVKRNRIIKGVRLDRKQKDKVNLRGYGHFDKYLAFFRRDSFSTGFSATISCQEWQPLVPTLSLWRSWTTVTGTSPCA